MSKPIDTGSIHILVVDDEPEITRLFEEYLRDLGYTVFPVTTSEAAQKVFSEKKIDVILLDINMPRISGLNLLKGFKKTNPDVIVIMVTAIQDIDIVVKCMQMGAYDYLVKPIIDLNQINMY
jgi:DNA-binding NtrC family response regulator